MDNYSLYKVKSRLVNIKGIFMSCPLTHCYFLVKVKARKIPTECSIYTTELLAILQAVEIANNTHQNNITMVSDSKALF